MAVTLHCTHIDEFEFKCVCVCSLKYSNTRSFTLLWPIKLFKLLSWLCVHGFLIDFSITIYAQDNFSHRKRDIYSAFSWVCVCTFSRTTTNSNSAVMIRKLYIQMECAHKIPVSLWILFYFYIITVHMAVNFAFLCAFNLFEILFAISIRIATWIYLLPFSIWWTLIYPLPNLFLSRQFNSESMIIY